MHWPRDAEALRLRALEAQKAGDLSLASRLFQQLLDLSPNDPQILNTLGIICLQRGEVQLSCDYHRRAVAADAHASVLLVNLAKAQRAANDDAGELDSLDKALNLDPRDVTALTRRAQLYERRGKGLDACRDWRALLALTGGNQNYTPEFEEILRHARTSIAEQHKQYESYINDNMEECLADLSKLQRRRASAFMDVYFGRRSVYVNRCAAFYFPFIPADEFFPEEYFPWFATIAENWQSVLEEFTRLEADGLNDFEPYVSFPQAIPDNLWTKLNHSKRWNTLHLWRYGRRNENACQACPQTVKLLESLPLAHLADRAPSAFFSILAPRTHIPPHTGVTNARTIIHLPLVVPQNCSFRVGGETRQWVEGQPFAFDDTIEHEAWNNSDSPRAVLIFDVWNPHLSPEEILFLQRFFEVSAELGVHPDNGHDW